jgi:D-tyrosyl-tRNA(Tyr) deacylase
VKALLQRVSSARVEVDGKRVGEIGAGLLVLVGVEREDTERDADSLADKIAHLRVFRDSDGKMNLSVVETGGGILAVSQFTLLGDTRKGRRPSFDRAAPPDKARELYEYFIAVLRRRNIPVATGVFQADMQVHLVNDGPVTILCESKNTEK